MADFDLTKQGDYEERIVAETLSEFSELVLWRNGFAPHWEEIAQLILPASRNTFYFASFNWPGLKKTDRQVDATGMLALTRFASIVDSLVTPRNMIYHGLAPLHDELLKSRKVRMYMYELNSALFAQRYLAPANFVGQQHANYLNLGAFGTQAMFVDHFDDPHGGAPLGLRYRGIPMGELFLKENHQGLVDGFIRWFRMSASQAVKMFGVGACSASMLQMAAKGSLMPLNFLHRVCHRSDYQPDRIDKYGMPWASYYVCADQKWMMRDGGYNSFPMAVGRYVQTPGEIYGRSPAMSVLPALKTLNAEKADFLTIGHRAAKPVLLTSDDGLVDRIDQRPGAFNPGGVGPNGEELVKVLPPGNIQITLEMMQEERDLINDAFLVKLFQILEKSPEMTATEVIERVTEKGILIAPTVGRQEAEYVATLVEREIDVLQQQDAGRNKRILPMMPPELIEAGGQFKIVHTSPLARAAKAQEAAGLIRSVESIGQLVQVTGDPSPLDNFNLDAGSQGVARIQGVPEPWLNTEQQKAKIRAGRARAQQQEMRAKTLPAEAAMVKAKAVVAAQQLKQNQGEQGVPPAPMMTQ